MLRMVPFGSSSRAGTICAVLAAALAVAVPTAGAIDDPSRRKSQVDARVRALDAQVDATAARVEAAGIALTKATAQVPPARATLARARASAAVARLAAAAASEQERVNRTELLRIARVRDALATDMLTRRDAVAAVVRRAYTGGDLARLGVALGARSPAELTSSMAYLQTVTRSQRTALDALARAEQAVARQGFELTRIAERVVADRIAAGQALTRAAAAERAALAAQSQVAALVAGRSDALEEARKLKAEVEARFAVEKAESARLARIIAARMGAARVGKGTLRLTGGLIAAPVLGRITSGYGMRYHPILRRNKMHTGVDFAAPRGTPIRAALAGEVISVSYNAAYGRRVIVDHGMVAGVYLVTTYNHLSRWAVREGQQLTQGQVLGNLGSTGWSTGPHLHLETLVDGRFVDPMRLLRRR